MWLFKLKSCLLLILLTSCTLRPLYSYKNSEIFNSFASIEVVDKNAVDKQNMDLVEQLKDSLDYYEKNLEKKYILEISYNFSYANEMASRSQSYANVRVKLDFNYVLKNKISQKAINSGNFFSTGVYNITDSQLGSYNARNYIKQSIIKEVIDNIKESLSITLFNIKL